MCKHRPWARIRFLQLFRFVFSYRKLNKNPSNSWNLGGNFCHIKSAHTSEINRWASRNVVAFKLFVKFNLIIYYNNVGGLFVASSMSFNYDNIESDWFNQVLYIFFKHQSTNWRGFKTTRDQPRSMGVSWKSNRSIELKRRNKKYIRFSMFDIITICSIGYIVYRKLLRKTCVNIWDYLWLFESYHIHVLSGFKRFKWVPAQ